MYPELFRIGDFPITSYGIWLALGMLFALFAAARLAAQSGIPKDRVYDLGMWTLVGGLVGSKLLMIIVEPHTNIFSLDFLRSGGVVYGGIIGGFLTVALLVRYYKLPFWRTADAFAPAVALGQAFGRQGCFAAGCCFGKPTTAAWGVHFTDAGHEYTGVPVVGPVVALYWLHKRKAFDGQILIIYAAFYSIFRFVIEFIRDDPRGELFGLTAATGLSTSQIVSLLVAMFSVIFLIYRLRNPREAEPSAS
jgi:phosphatidylglycerol:prolipoprotein diacylglycerol transferase